MFKLFSCFVIPAVFLLATGCGGSSGGDGDSVSEEMTTEEVANPIARTTEFFGAEGNLYKPRSDITGAGAGNLVVLFSSKFTQEFNSCETTLNTGEVAQLICINTEEWTQVPFSCFSNGNRQTWRANFKCEAMAEVKVTCFDDNQEIDFTVPEAQRGQICSRF